MYGIGRYTATLIPEIPEFNIVGLMDRDDDNIGKNMYGLPIIGKAEAEKNADLIIINTGEDYWKMIYSRIKDLRIPVYYLNGELAHEDTGDKEYENNPYWEQTYDELCKKTEHYDVILENIRCERENYRAYLEKINIGSSDGVVDLWFNGSNQYYVSKFVGKSNPK